MYKVQRDAMHGLCQALRTEENEMTMIAVRPQDRAEAQSPLERKMARARPLFLDQRVLEVVAQESAERLIKLGQKLQTK